MSDAIIQDKQTQSMRNMRTAIGSTKVVLDMAILPCLILISSRLIILDEKVAGVDNILKVVDENMRFGKNKGLNYSERKQQKKHTKSNASKTN